MIDLHPKMIPGPGAGGRQRAQGVFTTIVIDHDIARTLEVSAVDHDVAGQKQTGATVGPTPVQRG
jgi:hypothetical protein